MILKRFLLHVVLLVVMIALAGLLVVWSFTLENLFIARITFIALWLVLIVWLIYYITKTNRTLKVFMDSLRYLDSVRVQKGKGRLFEELDKLYNEVLGIIRKVETEKETERQYFKSIIDHTGTGLLIFDESGKVETVNSAFLKLLGIQKPEHISALTAVSAQMPEILNSLKPGKPKLLRVQINVQPVGLWIRMAEIRISGKKLKLASIQNIQPELEDEETDAWQKLIRVLTHEIMNSVTPVNSLTNTIIKFFERSGKPLKVEELDDTVIENALEALHSIEKRNRGLIGFVQSYRSLTRVQKPSFTVVNVDELLLRVTALIKHELEIRRIHLVIDVEKKSLMLNADEKLVEQVLLNLINNAMYALRETIDPSISIRASKQHDEILVEIRDNGEGISPEVLGNIFVPFFTTKPEGSGIGLSLSRQIMKAHGGGITVRSDSVETAFTLRFPDY
ncbi:MAG TPA: ATP-binding protein [Bacteroidales bacterium]|nr:ATP-binding protein [Bacteroidales bacterium]